MCFGCCAAGCPGSWPAEVRMEAAPRAARCDRFVRSCAQPRCRTEKKNVGISPPRGLRTFDGCVAGLAGEQADERMFHRIMVLLSEKTKSFWISFHGEAGRSLLLFRTRASVSGVPAGRGLLLLFGPLLSARFFNGSSKAVSPLRPVSCRPLLRLLKVEPPARLLSCVARVQRDQRGTRAKI